LAWGTDEAEVGGTYPYEANGVAIDPVGVQEVERVSGDGFDICGGALAGGGTGDGEELGVTEFQSDRSSDEAMI